MQTFDVFAIGDKVFVPRIFHKELPAEKCPDCLGAGTWHVSTPAGLSHDITCPRCNGKKDSNWLWPKRFELTLEISECTITEVSITRSQHKDVITTNVRYNTAPYIGSLYDAKVYPTREEAEAAGEAMKIAEAEKKDTDYAKERERQIERAGQDIVTALRQAAGEKVTELEAQIERLKEKMMDAIRHPSLYGPKIKSSTYLGPEITSQAMADWLSEMLQEADIEGWSENELHEAMCSC